MEPNSQVLVDTKNTMQVLKLFSDKRAELGLNEVSVQMGLAESEIMHIFMALVQGNVLEKNEATGNYRLSHFLNENDLVFERLSPLARLVRPYVVKASRQLNKIVQFHVRVDDELVAIVSADNGIGEIAGQRMPLLATIPGIVALAFTENDPLGYLSRATSIDLSSKDRMLLVQFLEMVEFEGYAEGREMNMQHSYTCACPVFHQVGDTLGVLSVTMPEGSVDEMGAVAKATAKFAQNLSICLAD